MKQETSGAAIYLASSCTSNIISVPLELGVNFLGISDDFVVLDVYVQSYSEEPLDVLLGLFLVNLTIGVGQVLLKLQFVLSNTVNALLDRVFTQKSNHSYWPIERERKIEMENKTS